MTSPAAVLNEARNWLGAKEEPRGSNHVPGITDWFGVDGAWCDMAVSRWLTDAGIPHRCAWVPAEVENAANGVDGFTLVQPDDIAPGDLICHDFGEAIKYAHIDIVEARDGDELTCIDGNWGDACVRVIRHVGDSSIQRGAVVRPPYGEVQPDPTPEPDHPTKERNEMIRDVLAMFDYIGDKNPTHDGVEAWVKHYEDHGASATWHAFMVQAAADGHHVP